MVIEVEDTLIADVTNDGKVEGVAHIICNFGGTGYFHYLAAYSISEDGYKKLTQMDSLELPEPDADIIRKISFRNNELLITFIDHLKLMILNMDASH